MPLRQKKRSYRQYGIVGKTQDLELEDQGLSLSSVSYQSLDPDQVT